MGRVRLPKPACATSTSGTRPRTALITGSGQGVGHGLARTFAQAGAHVLVNDLRAERAEDVAADIRADGGDARAVPFDVTDFAAVTAAINDAGPVDILVNNAGNAGPEGFGLAVPALWECKTMNAKNWRACVKDGVTKSKPVYAAQIAVYQAYMEASVPGISAAPAVFTAINKDTAEMHHELVPFDADLAQRMSDRGVRILQATDAGELLPRIAASADFFECRFCPWVARCWSLAP